MVNSSEVSQQQKFYLALVFCGVSSFHDSLKMSNITYDGALDVVEVGVVLERALQQAGLLAQLRHVRAVVVREHGVAQDRVRHLRGRHQVHL